MNINFANLTTALECLAEDMERTPEAGWIDYRGFSKREINQVRDVIKMLERNMKQGPFDPEQIVVSLD